MRERSVLFRYRLVDVNVNLIELVFMTSIFFDEPVVAFTLPFLDPILFDESVIVFTHPLLDFSAFALNSLLIWPVC